MVFHIIVQNEDAKHIHPLKKFRTKCYQSKHVVKTYHIPGKIVWFGGTPSKKKNTFYCHLPWRRKYLVVRGGGRWGFFWERLLCIPHLFAVFCWCWTPHSFQFDGMVKLPIRQLDITPCTSLSSRLFPYFYYATLWCPLPSFDGNILTYWVGGRQWPLHQCPEKSISTDSGICQYLISSCIVTQRTQGCVIASAAGAK